MGSKPDTELRQDLRLPISFPVFARGVDANKKQFKVLLIALNVSASGMLVLAASTFIPARDLRLDLPVGVVGEEVRHIIHDVEAEVVRIERRVRNTLLGLKFRRRIA